MFEKFRQLLEGNNRVLEIIAELEDKFSGEYIFDINYIKKITAVLSAEMAQIISHVNFLSGGKYHELSDIQNKIEKRLKDIVSGQLKSDDERYVIPLQELDRDYEELVGMKNANLGEIKNHIGFTVPQGFAITLKAYEDFLEQNQIRHKIERLASVERIYSDPAERKQAIQDIFSRAVVPAGIRKAVKKELKSLQKRVKDRAQFAVRSSGVGEDRSGKSFAGQFLSLLNVPEDQICDAFKRVICSRFEHFTRPEEDAQSRLAMAVAVQKMVNAKVSGVIYSLDPNSINSNQILISAVYGLGSLLVSGRVNGDLFLVSRLNTEQILQRKVVTKESMMILSDRGGTQTVQVPTHLRSKPCLTDEQIVRLAEIAFILDRSLKRPQDIEWAIDENDQIYILQSRPLTVKEWSSEKTAIYLDHLDKYPVLMKKSGIIANRGIAAGKVIKISDDFDPEKFPVGAIAVTKFTSPRLAKIVQKTAAIITDVGSSTGHMATIAREFGVPAIIGTEYGTQILKDDLEITVDANENIIYSGIINELLEYNVKGEDVYIEMPEYKMLRRILKSVSPLYLIDPNSSQFTAKNCRTYHDLIRFAHEKAMQELINLNISSKRFPEIKLKELNLPIPLGLKMIDIGGGLTDAEHKEKRVSTEQVSSFPMKAVLEGLTAPHVWSTDPVDLGFGDFMSSITRYSLTEDRMDYQGQNLAVISKDYMNLSLRLGYHFNVVDAYVTKNINDNYIYFRFVGGVTESERRIRRAIVIQSILERIDFKVVLQGDLVVARLKKRTAEQLAKTLTLIGRLIGFTRQLDARMQSEEAVSYYSNRFFELSRSK